MTPICVNCKTPIVGASRELDAETVLCETCYYFKGDRKDCASLQGGKAKFKMLEVVRTKSGDPNSYGQITGLRVALIENAVAYSYYIDGAWFAEDALQHQTRLEITGWQH